MSAAEVTPEYVARCFHAHYERLAPDYGYETRPESAVAFDDVPLTNRALMTDVARHVLRDIADRTSTATGCQQCIEVAIRYEQERDAAVACAEKAERERDALRDQLNEAKLQNVLHLDRIDALLSTPAPLPPMTTVTEDGTVCRVVKKQTTAEWYRLVPIEAES